MWETHSWRSESLTRGLIILSRGNDALAWYNQYCRPGLESQAPIHYKWAWQNWSIFMRVKSGISPNSDNAPKACCVSSLLQRLICSVRLHLSVVDYQPLIESYVRYAALWWPWLRYGNRWRDFFPSILGLLNDLYIKHMVKYIHTVASFLLDIGTHSLFPVEMVI